ncbi:hypothetical protein [Psychroserpens sp.]|uniref:hypothetical protein n=1 Tax=Psychroserpens sp. TaxID=2020870 RepID=UPI001B26BD34|nr:hypothetical protein [Psychroserpens sp.]MBO6607073.1 hypothetical protein [Psychroserpens sp.]MBO6631986.1 hypothetical protein [Psychroserpens sp.]MBO6654219.1 hypothetical protein [Psychroserpens sp.]MBO6682495.1 hypothetical protein [Psychroserpens sp.]MBO6750845.1 hypothetical protein [Psychroserpens sp.]
MLKRNTLVLLYTALIFIGFFLAGLFNVLDYFIVKAILFAAFGLFGIYLTIVIVKDSEAS